MGAIVGIDLGTTNTVVAAMRDGAPVAIKDETGSSVIPSIVSFLPSGAVLVGDAAKERRNDDPKNTVFSVKRLIGRPWDSPEVTQARQRFSFDLKEGPGRATFVIARGETFTLPEISAYVLRKAKSIAELELSEPVDRAIITVPANFNDLQRAATKVAGRVAGLDVLRIINEPTAAALAYGFGQGTSETVAVFDFGGGTFDITLLKLTENVFEVLATAGDTFLGGDDLDWVIVQKMMEAANSQLGRDVHDDPVAIEHLRAAAETLKMNLSTSERAEVQIDLISQAAGAGQKLVFAMSQAEFELLAAPILERAFEVCREALALAKLDVKALNHVVAVGGCTRIPLVRKRAKEFFGRALRADLDPHEVVAIGAALQGYALTTPVTTAQVDVPLPPATAEQPTEEETNDLRRRKTNPFGRVGTTNVGVGQAMGPGKFESIQVPNPEGVPSGPVPNTQNLVSRGRLNTAIGLGSDLPLVDHLDWEAPQQTHAEPDAASFDPESLLPVVTGPNAKRLSQAVFRAPEFATDAKSLAEPDDDEATMVRPPIGFTQADTGDLPGLANENTPPSQYGTSAVPPTLHDIEDEDAVLPSVTAGSEGTRNKRADQLAGDLPAIAEPLAGSAPRVAQEPRDTENRRLSKPPTTDELRQRYGDLPLIIGGKRLSNTPKGAPSPDLPLVRPSLDTIEDTTPLPELLEHAQSKPRAPAATIADAEIHPELPLVGVGARTVPERIVDAPKASPQRKPVPPRAAPARTQPNPAVLKTVPSSTPLALSDSDVEDETRSQPPSAGRISIKPGMRLEPGEENSLPLPDLPVPNVPPMGPVAARVAQAAPNIGNVQQNRSEPRKPAPQDLPPNRSIASGVTEPTKTRPLAAATQLPTDFVLPSAAALGTSITETGFTPGVVGRSDATPSAPLIPAIAPAARPLRNTGVSSSPGAYGMGGVAVPLLLDVTPLSLSVETVGVYCDVLLDRNTPVPCERTREFVTVQDGQQTVRLRVAQGESRIFAENLLLGELELTGLRPAPRGQLRISVTFGLDSDGMLHVRAIDLDTGRATTSELRLAGIPSPAEITQMASRQLRSS